MGGMKFFTPRNMGVAHTSPRGHITLLVCVLLCVPLALTACGPLGGGKTVEIDWVNFVRFHSVTYLTPTVPVGRAHHR